MMDFLLATAAVFTALTMDRIVGSAVQLWGTRRVGQMMMRSSRELKETQIPESPATVQPRCATPSIHSKETKK